MQIVKFYMVFVDWEWFMGGVTYKLLPNIIGHENHGLGYYL